MVDFSSFLPVGLPANPALLPTLLDLLPMGVMYYTPVLDATGTLTDLALAYLNPAAQRMTQLPAQPGTTYRQQFPTTDDNGAWDFHRRTWLSGEPQHFQFYYDADGFDSYFRVASQRLGEGLLTIFTDTQDEVRSQVEVALLASQTRERAAHAEAEAERRRFQEVLMQLPAQVAVNRGPDHVFALVNAPYQQLFPTRLMQGLPVRQVLPELEGQQFFDMLDRVYQTGEPFYSRAMPASANFTNTGRLEQRYVDVFFQALHDAQGRIDGILNFSYDVTEQELARQQVQTLNEELAALNAVLRATNDEYQQANIALSESRQQLWQFTQELEARVQERTQVAEQALAEAERQRRIIVELVQQAPAAMCIVEGPNFVYETFNPLYADMFGGRPQLGRPMGEVLPEVVNHPGFLAFRAVYEEGHTFRQSDVLVPLARPSDGVLENHYFSYTQQPRYDQQGQIDGVFVFAVEVTDQVQARQQVQALNAELTATNAELNKSNTQLTRTNVDLDNFIYTASHDLKAPITNIEGLLLALEHELPTAARPGDVSLMLTMMQGAVDRFRRTIDHLTDLSRLQKEHTPDADAVALASVVEAVRLDLTPLLRQTQGQLTVTIPAGLTVTFAEKNLRSVVYNLLSNAFKYRHPDRPPEVQLRGWPAADYIMLEVQDNGLGLDLLQGQERLFAMFQRLHTHVEGTGVGLYMVKRIVENAGGRIEVRSELGQGSTFQVYFPR